MSFRRAFAGVFILIFVVIALPTFLYFGVSNSILRPSFYEGPIAGTVYDFLLKVSTQRLIKADEVITEHFTESDIRTEIMSVYPLEMFKKNMAGFASQLEAVKSGASRSISFSLNDFRQSLLTFANNLAYKLFQSLPICQGGQIPEQDTRGLPTCVPPGVEYNNIAAPFSQRFEAAVYMAVPEPAPVDLNAVQGPYGVTLGKIFDGLSVAKYYLYGSLMFMLILIALLVYGPFSLIVKYEGIAFIYSGVAGYLMGWGMSYLPGYLLADANLGDMKPDVLQMSNYAMSFVVAESQKIALIFLALGAVLVLIRVFLTYKYNNEKTD